MGRLSLLVVLVVAGCGAGDDDNSGASRRLPYVGFAPVNPTSVDETIGELAIDVRLSEPSSERVTVYIDVSGSATLGEDFEGAGGVLVFLPGVEYATALFAVIDDGVAEDAEAIQLTLDHESGARLGMSEHTVIIRSNLLPRVAFASANGVSAEGSTNTVELQIVPPAPQDVTVDYQVGGTASAADVSLAPSGTFTIPAGASGISIPIETLADVLDEDDETVEITISNPQGGAMLGDQPTYKHYIDDDDPTVITYFSPSTQVVTEGNAGMQLVTATVELNAPSGRVVEVPFAVKTNSFLTASAGSDFAVITQSPLTFAVGETTRSITIAIYGDTVQEGTETFGVELGASDTADGWSLHVVTIDNDECIGTGSWSVCPDDVSMSTLTTPSSIYTGIPSECADEQPPGWIEAGNPEACFIVADTITVTSLRAEGSRPLVLVGLTSITVQGLLDVSGTGPSPGAGADPVACSAFPASPGPQSGGAGGSFITSGANGGGHTGPAGAGGVSPAAIATPSLLHGGCSGQAPTTNAPYIDGGGGGGAVYLIAGSTITIASGATVDASGGYGTGGTYHYGGGGGGSGGMIALRAPTIIANGARLLANGAGGGEGGDNTGASSDGYDGGEPNITTPLTPALGGFGTTGGDGGNGAVQGTAASVGAVGNNDNGGGGGGGGLGYIRSTQPLTGATCSPTPALL